MPLSEDEQRILDEIEKHLHEEDPRLARGVGRRGLRLDESSLARLGTATFVIGFAMLFGFFIKGWLLLGVAAFAAMVGGIVLLAGSMRNVAPSTHGGDRFRKLFREWDERVRSRYKRK